MCSLSIHGIQNVYRVWWSMWPGLANQMADPPHPVWAGRQELVQVEWLLSLEEKWAGEMFSRAGTAGSPPSSSPSLFQPAKPSFSLEAENVLLAPILLCNKSWAHGPRVVQWWRNCLPSGDARDAGVNPWIRKILESRNDHPLQWFLSRKFHGPEESGESWSMSHKSEAWVSTHICTQTKS